jgi:hypothetical protein
MSTTFAVKELLFTYSNKQLSTRADVEINF